jgi:hypothetical protein
MDHGCEVPGGFVAARPRWDGFAVPTLSAPPGLGSYRVAIRRNSLNVPKILLRRGPSGRPEGLRFESATPSGMLGQGAADPHMAAPAGITQEALVGFRGDDERHQATSASIKALSSAFPRLRAL